MTKANSEQFRLFGLKEPKGAGSYSDYEVTTNPSIVAHTNCRFRIEHQWGSDYSSEACLTYTRNICPKKPMSVLCKDVRQLEIEDLAPIDAFAYGFPCNDFSIVGEKKGFGGEYGPLYTYGLKVLNHFKPKFFVAENVGGLQSANEGASFRTILADLAAAGNGYRITAHLYDASEYGVPQTRKRIIIVGIDATLNLTFRVPKPTTAEEPVTARQALENPPIPPGAANNEKTVQSKNVIERLNHIKPGENAWNSELPNHP